MAKKKRRSGGISASDLLTAQAEADVKYGPQKSTLRALIGEARDAYHSDIAAAKAGAESAVKTARHAKKPLAKVYRQSLSAIADATKDVGTTFNTLGSGADPYRAVTSREAGAYKHRVASAKADALKELSSRQVEAQAGRAYAINSAKADYNKTVASLSDRLADLAGQQGSYVAGRVGSLSESQANRQNQIRLAREQGKQARQTAKTKEKLSGGGKGKGKGKSASSSDLKLFSTEFNRLATTIKNNRNDAKGKPHTRGFLANVLTGGQSGSGKQTIGAAKDDLALSVALDMTYDGHVSRYNARRMKQRGLKVGDFPRLKSYSDYFASTKRPNSTMNAYQMGALH